MIEDDSSRRVCEFAEGLIEGAAKLYRERIEVKETACTFRGDSRCRFEIQFQGPR